MKTVAILCVTFLVVLVAYWIMPEEKMKAVNKELKSLLQILPITAVIKAITGKESEDEP